MDSAISTSRLPCAALFRTPSCAFCRLLATMFSTTSRKCSAWPRSIFCDVLSFYDLSDHDDPGRHLAAAADRYISPGLLSTRRCHLARTGSARALAAAPASGKLRRQGGVSQAL